MGGRRGPACPSGWSRFGILLLMLLLADIAWAARLEVQVTGLAGPEQANVMALLSIEQERGESELSPERIEALHRLAPEQIRNALAPFGLYRVEVSDELVRPADPNGTWIARYAVVPGPAVRIGVIDYAITGEGADDPAFPKTFPMQVGDVLLHANYEAAKADLRFRASAAGYLGYVLERHRVLIDLVAYEAIVEFHLNTGPRHYIGEIEFKQDLLNDAFIRRFVDFEPGVVYNPDLLLGLQSRLLGSEYFSSVDIVPQDAADGDGSVIPIQVIATRNLPNKYRVGLGIATDTGPRFSADWRRRYVNQWGHRFRTELQLAPALSEWSLDYRIPIQDPTRDYIVIKPQSSVYDLANKSGWQHTVQVAHSTLTPGGWRRNLGVELNYEDLDSAGARGGSFAGLVPNASWSRTVADDPINTNRGYRLRYGLLGSLGGVISDASFLSGTFQIKWIRRFAEDYRLITRSDLGVTLAGELDDVPVSRRFFAGGDNSLRGWGFDALGPIDPVTQEVIGGRYLAVGSLELERRLTGPWSAALFTDFGNAFDPDYEQSFSQSVGLGVRWASPIGPVRMDLAFDVTDDDTSGSGGLPPARLHFVIGPDL
ncbi:MAG: outer membrane protein assembly factor [Gammaproteobacteria bacterium]|nr:outer membrane protein assembly factor [Gammaproteobacteria bacterium]